MTDNEIIKALECCIKHTECPKCPMKGTRNCMSELNKDALDLINRQKAEIENLNIELKAMRGAANSYKAEIERLKFRKCLYSGLYSEYDIKLIRDCTQGECFHRESEEAVRLDAIKEFAERFNSVLADYDDYDTLHIYEIMDRIDLVKEMVGDGDA